PAGLGRGAFGKDPAADPAAARGDGKTRGAEERRGSTGGGGGRRARDGGPLPAPSRPARGPRGDPPAPRRSRRGARGSLLQALRYFFREALVNLARGFKVSLLAVLTITVSLILGGV